MKKAKADYTRVSDELWKVQTALDVVNTTVMMEFELPDQDAFRLRLFCRTQASMLIKLYKVEEAEV